ncbi:MAG: hypothetical protein HXX09_16275 [Bacteroidetes bacterium]|nr:hypothetical protein [Bacteroidota bacterium]
MKTKVIMAIVIVAFMAGCKKNSTTDNSSYTPSCSGATKSWITDVKPLMDSYCVNCHSSYGSYSSVSNSKTNIRSRIVSGSMPQSGSLSTDQKDKIVCWIDNGAPNN